MEVNSSEQLKHKDSHFLYYRGLSTVLHGKVRNIDQRDLLYRILAKEFGGISFSALQQMSFLTLGNILTSFCFQNLSIPLTFGLVSSSPWASLQLTLIS